MAECILMQGGGGVGSDDLTATASKVLYGYKYMGYDSDDDIRTGAGINENSYRVVAVKTVRYNTFGTDGYFQGGTSCTFSSAELGTLAGRLQKINCYVTISYQSSAPKVDAVPFISSVSGNTVYATVFFNGQNGSYCDVRFELREFV